MKRLILFTFLLLKLSDSLAQFGMDVSYKQMYSSQWDRAIQTYNLSRPFLSEKQPLLTQGVNLAFFHLTKTDKKFKHGVNLSYSFFRSTALNENLENTINLHFLQLGYMVCYENVAKSPGLYCDMIVSAISSGLFRKVNGELFQFDGITAKAMGIGCNLDLKIGYHVKWKNETFLSPFVSVGYTPYLYSPNGEVILNQTKGLTSKAWTGIATTQVGVKLHLMSRAH